MLLLLCSEREEVGHIWIKHRQIKTLFTNVAFPPEAGQFFSIPAQIFGFDILLNIIYTSHGTMYFSLFKVGILRKVKDGVK